MKKYFIPQLSDDLILVIGPCSEGHSANFLVIQPWSYPVFVDGIGKNRTSGALVARIAWRATPEPESPMLGMKQT